MANLLGLDDLSAASLERLVASIVCPAPDRAVEGKRVALLWNVLAVRNRAAVDLAAHELGLVCVDAKSVLGGREGSRDLARYLDNWFDAYVIRGATDNQLDIFASWSRGGVLNAGGPDSHPTEVLSDVAYLQTRFGHFSGLTLGFVGPSTNVLTSWLQAASALSLRVVQISPAPFWAHPPATANFSVSDTPAALADVDVVYTDCWWPVRLASPRDRNDLQRQLEPYRLTEELLQHAPPEAPILHGPPISPGLEIDETLQDSRRYAAWDAKKWLLPTMKTCLLEILGKK